MNPAPSDDTTCFVHAVDDWLHSSTNTAAGTRILTAAEHTIGAELYTTHDAVFRLAWALQQTMPMPTLTPVLAGRQLSRGAWLRMLGPLRLTWMVRAREEFARRA